MLRRAFTLFEIGISLLILSVAIISTAMLFPVGIKAQQLARSRIYAVDLALNLMDAWTQQAETNHNRQVETEFLSGNTFVHRAREDMERTMLDYNLRPLPPAIASRLDSDHDEILTVLNQGGCLYYPSAGLNTPQSLIVAVIGYPQQNALPNHPCLSWPYIDHVPGPPHDWELTNWRLNSPAWPCLAEFEALHGTFNSSTHADATPDDALADAYVKKAQALVTALAVALGMPTDTTVKGVAPQAPTALPSAPWSETDPNVFPHPAWIWGCSHLAHAAACLTAPQISNSSSADTIDYAKKTFDAATAWMMRYASTDAYDWGMPRESGHLCGWDFPLTQFDLFPSSAFPMFKASSVTADPTWSEDVSWRVVARKQTKNYGQGRGYHGWWWGIGPNKPQIDASWGDPAHFTLTRAFQPCERARQLVFYSVDWQAYEDFEEVTPGLLDSSLGIFDSQGVQIGSEAYGIWYAERPCYFADASRTRLANTVADFAINSEDEPRANTAAHKAIMLGLYGADRNGSGAYERGVIPKSVRMKAIVVSRFNFYDRIVPFSSRG